MKKTKKDSKADISWESEPLKIEPRNSSKYTLILREIRTELIFLQKKIMQIMC